MSHVVNVLREFLILGLTAFGGPTAHIGFFRDRFVEKLNWLSDEEFADTLALCQFLPGPASSQLGFAIGWKKAGLTGAFAAWLGFTLPSAILMTLVGIGISNFGGSESSGWLPGLKIAVVIVIFKAILQMGKSLCPDRKTILIAMASAAFILWDGVPLSQLLVILVGAIVGLALLRSKAPPAEDLPSPSQSKETTSRLERGEMIFAVSCLVLFFALLIGVYVIKTSEELPQLFALFYKSGALVFGGGHVVLPLLNESVVGAGWISEADFIGGYGIAQAVPGPLFTFSSFVGSSVDLTGNPWVMSAIALIGIFLPSWLLMLGVMPFWSRLSKMTSMKAALAGANSAVVGLLAAAFYDPIWKESIYDAGDVIFLIMIAAMVFVGKLPPWIVVILAGVGGWLFL